MPAAFRGPDRRINPARTVQFTVGNLADHLLVERFAHAVQALELILAGIVVLPGQLINGCQGVGVVGGELRVDQARHRQQLFRAGEVGDVGIHFAGIDRVAFEAVHLRAFDFAVPVGAFTRRIIRRRRLRVARSIRESMTNGQRF
jgi:hypothetical protein